MSDVLDEENNGTTIAAMNLIRSLKEKGHEVKIVCPVTKYHNGDDFYFVPKLKLPKVLQNIVDKNNVVIGRPKKKIFYEAMKDCDVVHVMIPLFIGPKAARFAKKKLHKPVTIGFHAQAENVSSHILGLMNSKMVNKVIYKHYYNKAYKYADCIHYPTNFIRNVFEDIVGDTNGYVISNGVQKIFKPTESERPEELKNKKVILFTGRLSLEKSHSILIKAISKSKYEKDIQLILAGQGPRKDEILKLSSKLLTNQPIINFYSREELVKIINYADLYCHPAEVEIEAISCLEAICCGLVPVIANSPKCATKEFALDERSLFTVNDPDSLRDKIDYWFDHPEELKEMKAKYANSASRFDFDECMDKMELMIKDAYKLNEK
ncbi:MAG: glycosyltransferase [Acholeplasmatales bacterium]|nr:glycosyltransferase [Acholeplasmatales bacterium]